MTRKHMPEEIIGKLREAEIVLASTGRHSYRGLPPDRRLGTELLSVAQGVWRSEDGPGASDEGSGAGECSASANGVGPDAGEKGSYKRLHGEASGPCPAPTLHRSYPR